MYERLDIGPGRPLGIIHLESVTEFDRPITLEELRANGVPFASNIVSGRTTTLEATATIFELGGLGVDASVRQAADESGHYDVT